MKLNSYSFAITFITLDLSYYESFCVDLVAPHYEAAVAQALAIGQQYFRDHNEEGLFMRVMKN